MSEKPWTMLTLKVGTNPQNYVTVRAWGDAPGIVELCTDGCHEYYGDQMITMEPAFAREVGLAMIRLADELEAEGNADE